MKRQLLLGATASLECEASVCINATHTSNLTGQSCRSIFSSCFFCLHVCNGSIFWSLHFSIKSNTKKHKFFQPAFFNVLFWIKILSGTANFFDFYLIQKYCFFGGVARITHFYFEEGLYLSPPPFFSFKPSLALCQGQIWMFLSTNPIFLTSQALHSLKWRSPPYHLPPCPPAPSKPFIYLVQGSKRRAQSFASLRNLRPETFPVQFFFSFG